MALRVTTPPNYRQYAEQSIALANVLQPSLKTLTTPILCFSITNNHLRRLDQHPWLFHTRSHEILSQEKAIQDSRKKQEEKMATNSVELQRTQHKNESIVGELNAKLIACTNEIANMRDVETKSNKDHQEEKVRPCVDSPCPQ